MTAMLDALSLGDGGAMPSSVTVKVYFEAAHRLHNPAKSEPWNQEVFGKCNNRHGHGHNYILEVSIRGAVDADSGYLMDMKDLKDLLRRVVVDEVDHRHLNLEVPWLADVIPTAENLAAAFYARIAPALPEAISLAAVTVHETDRNSATYWED
jgi:6-pyruvoyltetrahydropterin/6-carboxytetrahydropterin synthase